MKKKVDQAVIEIVKDFHVSPLLNGLFMV